MIAIVRHRPRRSPALRALCVVLTLLMLAACATQRTAAPAAPEAAAAPAAPALPIVDAAALERRLGEGDPTLVVIDARSPDEFAQGRVPGAINVPHDEVQARLAALDIPIDADIVVYCGSGRRARIVGQALAERGFRDVRELAGHFPGWRDAGRTVVAER